MNPLELAADCCSVTAGVLAVLLLERGDAPVRQRMDEARAALAKQGSRTLVDLWDLTQDMALQIADQHRDKKGAAGELSAAPKDRPASVPGGEESR